MAKESKTKPEPVISPLTADDLDAVVALDRVLSGISRRDFFQRRLERALEEPGDFVYVGLRLEDKLIGYALARLVDGEFGKPGASAALDAIGVHPDHQGKCAGRKLLAGVEDVLRHKGVSDFTSQIDWADRKLISFFASAGFELAPRIALARTTERPAF